VGSTRVSLGSRRCAAALGVVQSSTSGLTVAEVIAATTAAHSAQVTDRSVTSSANPDLRGTSVTLGDADFATGNSSSTTTSHSIVFETPNNGPTVETVQVDTTRQRSIGRQAYRQFAKTPIGTMWVKLPSAFAGHRGLVGTIFGIDASALGLLVAPASDLALTPLRTTTLGGTPVTIYHVDVTSPKAACMAGVPYATSGTVALGTEIWVDGRSRLVEAQSRRMFTLGRFPVRLGASLPAPGFTGTAVMTSTLLLRDFGEKVRVAAPPFVAPRANSSSLSLVATCKNVGGTSSRGHDG
jgi:hypothetical protein